MRILDHTGDTMVRWQVGDPATTAEAERIFERLSAERKLAFARRPGGKVDEAEQIRTFDPSAEEIIWVRPIHGG